MVKGIIFDLDGTLIDTIEGLANSVNYAMESYHFPTHSIAEYRSFVGNGVGKLVQRALPEGKKELKDEARAVFEKHYEETMLHILPVYDGIWDLLHHCRANGIKMSVNTNKLHKFAEPMIKKVFPDIFVETIGEVDYFKRKPAPDGGNYLLEKMGIERDECVYIGDSQVDIETARNLKMRSISVTWGFATKDILLANNPEIMVNTPYEIIDLIETWNRKDK